jgi:hypothetical protein
MLPQCQRDQGITEMRWLIRLPWNTSSASLAALLRVGQPLPFEFKAYRITDMQKAKTKKTTSIAWSKDEVKLIKKLYPHGGAREIVKRTGRPLAAVRQKAYHLGVNTGGNRPWSANEIRQLKRLYPRETAQSIADKLGRSCGAVTIQAFKLGLTEKLRVWSKKEMTLLKRLYPNQTAQEIADQIGRSVHATRYRIVILGLKKRESSAKN